MGDENQAINNPFEIADVPEGKGAGESTPKEDEGTQEGGKNTNTEVNLDDLKGKVPDEVISVMKSQNETIEKLREDKESLSKSVKGLADKNKQEKKETEKYKLKYEDIKRSKDLSKEELEEMTEEEIKAMDDKADMQESANEAYIAEQKAKEVAKQAEIERVEREIKDGAMKLADGDINLANKIIAEMNKFKGNADLDPDELQRRLVGARAMVPEFKGTQYQKTGSGSAITKNSTDSVDSIVDEVVRDRQSDTKQTFEI